uniref:Uncharacterized protein n=1 Tax=Strigamia maritima TaxID=126957 RepID=T1JBZ8_STRMM
MKTVVASHREAQNVSNFFAGYQSFVLQVSRLCADERQFVGALVLMDHLNYRQDFARSVFQFANYDSYFFAQILFCIDVFLVGLENLRYLFSHCFEMS